MSASRQPHRELGEVTDFAIDRDGAAVLLRYDLVAHRQPKPGALAAMPATRRHTAWGFRRRARLANMVIPREQQCYPRSVLPAEKFQQPDGEST